MTEAMQYYRVADLPFAIEARLEHFALLPNYEPFIADADASPMFVLHVSEEAFPDMEGWEHMHTESSEPSLPRVEIYRRADEWLFRLAYTRDGDIVAVLHTDADWSNVTLSVRHEALRFAVDFAAMMSYACCAAPHRILLFHASVVMRSGRGWLFLGRSGTGKSTHSQLWLSAFPDAELLNDDNPVVRILPDDCVQVYGSPWSGKTPCYRNLSVPVAALVQLQQAPSNAICPLKMTQAYPFLLSSVNGLKLVPAIMDRLYDTIAQLLGHCKVYKLDCLPNLEAAQLCAQTCLS